MFYFFTFVVATSRILYLVSLYLSLKDQEKYADALTISNITSFTAFYGKATLGIS